MTPEPRTRSLRADNLRGIAAILVAVGAFALMDASLKVLAPHYPALQVASLRGFASLPLVLAWTAWDGGLGQLRPVRFSLHLLRGGLGIAALAGFTYGLRHLSLADANSIFFVAPLLITALAVPLLGEPVDWRRWAAVGVGLIGVWIVLRPTGQGVVTLAGLGVLLAAASYALSAILVRVLGRTDTTQSMVFWVLLLIGLGAGALAWPHWRPIRGEHWGVLAVIAVAGTVGQYALTEAFRVGQASVVAPFEYSALAWSAGLDFWLWDVTPAPTTLAGAALIVSGGVYLIRRERAHAEAEHP